VGPATFVLTRHLTASRWPWARLVARVSASVVVILGLVTLFDHTRPVTRVLGLTSLVLAASIVILVVASERRRPLPDLSD
jgi:chromate transport protein ChrA